MDTRLTLGDACRQLYTLVTPDDQNSALLRQVINEVSERLLNNGSWKGTIIKLTFDNSNGYITLPYNYASVVAMTYDRCPVAPVFTQFHKYIENGPGEIDETKAWPGILIDLGDGFVTQTDISSGDEGQLRIYSSANDNGVAVRLYGIDENDALIFDDEGNEGEEVILSSPSVLTTKTYKSVTGFTKPPTTAKVRINVVPATSGNSPYQIAEYLPSETRPCYKRYQTGVITDKTVRMLCRRRFVPMIADTDWVYPGNLSALRAGVASWLFENNSDMDSADRSFARALAFLNDEAKTFRGGGRPTINIEAFDAGRTPFGTVA
jgi:hypothetical protein